MENNIELISNEKARELLDNAIAILQKKDKEEQLFANTTAMIEPSTGVVTAKLFKADETLWEIEVSPEGEVKVITEYVKKEVANNGQ